MLIDFNLDWRALERISWHELEATLASEPDRFRDHLLLVGSTYTGAGDGPHVIPHPRSLPDEVPGPILQALIVHTLLDDARLRQLPRAWTQVAAGLLATLAALTVFLGRPPWHVLMAAALWGLGSYAGFVHGRLLLPLAPTLMVMLVATIGAVALRRPLSVPTK